MTLDFVQENFYIGQKNPDIKPTLTFFRKGFRIGGSSSIDYRDIIISGNTALTLVNAKANGLNYVKLFGACEQRNLPEGYTQIKSLKSDGKQFIDTGFIADSDIVTYKFKLSNLGTANNTSLFGSEKSTSGSYSCVPFRAGNAFYIYIGNSNIGETISNTDVEYEIEINNNTITIYRDGSPAAPYSFTGSIKTDLSVYLFANHDSVSGAIQKCDCGYEYFQVYKNGLLELDLIPCRRNSDNILGMFDLVSQTLLTNQGIGTFTAGADVLPSPDTPVDIISNNGEIKFGKQVTINSTKINGYINTDGIWAYDTASYTVRIPVTSGNKYKIRFTTTDKSVVGSILRWGFTDSETNPTIYTSVELYDVQRTTPQSTTSYESDITATKNYMVLQITNSYAASVLTNGYITLSEQVVYTDGTVETVTDSLSNTATAEMLLKVGDYVDTQEILTGLINHQLGILVLKGDEDAGWNMADAGRVFRTELSTLYPTDFASNPNNNIAVCSHFKVTSLSTGLAVNINDGEVGWNTNGAITFRNDGIATLSRWKQWLADQYAAGTPVIIVYPLAESTTETVTGQALTTQAGTNIVEITQASIDNLALEVSYKGKQ